MSTNLPITAITGAGRALPVSTLADLFLSYGDHFDSAEVDGIRTAIQTGKAFRVGSNAAPLFLIEPAPPVSNRGAYPLDWLLSPGAAYLRAKRAPVWVVHVTRRDGLVVELDAADCAHALKLADRWVETVGEAMEARVRPVAPHGILGESPITILPA